jgi:hypothetical protein
VIFNECQHATRHPQSGQINAQRVPAPPDLSPRIQTIPIVKINNDKIADGTSPAVTFAAVINASDRNASVITANFICTNKMIRLSSQTEVC